MSENVYRQILAETGQSPATRQKLFEAIEGELDGRVLVSFFTSFAFPVQITDDDCDMLQSVLQQLDLSKGLALLVSSPGGDGLAAERIVNVCRAYSGTEDYWTIVPGKAKSAATLISMGASKILMSPSSELGPVDPQIIRMENGDPKYFSAHGLVTGYDKLFKGAVRVKGNLEPYVQQLGHYDDREINKYRDFIKLSNDIAKKVLKTGMMSTKTEKQIEKSIEIFLKPYAGTYSHGRPIFLSEAQKCGLNIEEMDVASKRWGRIYELYTRLDKYVSSHACKAVESKSEAFFVGVPRRD